MSDDEFEFNLPMYAGSLLAAVESFDEDWIGTVRKPHEMVEHLDITFMWWLNDLPESLEAAGVKLESEIASTRVNLKRWRNILTPMFPDLGSYNKPATEGPDAIDDLIEIVYELERACIVHDYWGERAGLGYLRFSHRAKWGPRWERLRAHIQGLSSD